MIEVYQQPSEANPTVAFTWSDFREFKMYLKDQKFENVPTAIKFLEDFKCWILISGFEEFRIYFTKAMQEYPDIQDPSLPNVIDSLREACEAMIQDQENYPFVLQTIVEKANFMRILVKASPEKYFPVMKMMATKLIKYCKAELDERQKDQNQAQVSEGNST
jgi:hypothetical protein